MPRISMLAEFQILKLINGDYVPLKKSEVTGLSVGGFDFYIDGKAIPFDWTAFSASWSEDETTLELETGTGFFKDYELDECHEEDWAKLGLTRNDLTAAFLSTVSHIEEFFVFFDTAAATDLSVGYYFSNAQDQLYRLKIKELRFYDLDTEKYHDVADDVLQRFNKGVA